LGQDELYGILHPGDPVEHVFRFAEKYIYVADAGYSQLRASGQDVHLKLFDFNNNLVTEGTPGDQGLGERLSLASTVAGQIYALQVVPRVTNTETPALLEWDDAEPVRISNNLVLNPGGEDPVNDGIPFWNVPDGYNSPRLLGYSSEAGLPTSDGPGPSDRGSYFFAGGVNDNPLMGMRQDILIDPMWYQAISEGHLQFRFSAFLGGNLDEAEGAVATLTFSDANLQKLGEASLPSITPLDRAGQTGLFAVETSDYLPVGTYTISVSVNFIGAVGELNDGYADNIELILSDYTP
jgi:hypothetical protein